MVPVPAGRVVLTDRRSQRSWAVDVAAHQMSAHPVTQAQYAHVTGESPSTARGDRLPVEGVSWWDAVRFCHALSQREQLVPAYWLDPDGEGIEWDASADGYRLPTEAEWEHACRAGTGAARYGELDDVAWYRGNSEGRPHSVGGKQPNAWGLFDMLGNVWEWCEDRPSNAATGESRDPVMRGGCWRSGAFHCTAVAHDPGDPDLRADHIGFRVACLVAKGK